MAIQEVRVGKQEGYENNSEVAVLTDILTSEGVTVDSIQAVTVYSFEGISVAEADHLRKKILTDAVTEVSTVNEPLFTRSGDGVLRIGYQPGVTDPLKMSLFRVADAGEITPTAVATSIEYIIHGDVTPEALRLAGEKLAGKQIKEVKHGKPDTLLFDSAPKPVETVAITYLNEDELDSLSRRRSLFLNRQEMRVVQNHFRSLDREPTDVELETIAQTWSEHNGHKTFKAKLIDAETGAEKTPLIKRIRKTSEKYFDRVGVVTAFEDNSGGIRFYDGWVMVGKGETHNSPVALEPFGGAATKLGGLLRDPAGTGRGGENWVAFMVNNFASPDTDPADVPPGCLHPKYLWLNNKAGEAAFGNPMGVPTHIVDHHVHPGFVAKPTSMGVVIGGMEEKYAKKHDPRPGDLLVTVGGETGRDGIHGATFSSGVMTAETETVHATAVQLGDPISEKRAFDALIACRNAGLIQALTDVGGGGYSSAIGELGQPTGVRVQLEAVPLKYQGLSPWEIWLSESQERMVVAVAPEDWDAFKRICDANEAPATVIGAFTDDAELTLVHGEDVVGNISMEFLHHGLPQREMMFTYRERPAGRELPPMPADMETTYREVLGHWNVASMEAELRQFDTTVQAKTVVHPFVGVHQDTPTDASVIAPIPGKQYGAVVGGGSNPILNDIDPYWGSVWAVTKALTNYVAVGGNPDEAAFIDNFVWPFPDTESLADLDRSVDALCHMITIMETPCVSGKDSLSSTYVHADGTVLKIPPVLHMTVFGRIPDIQKTVTPDIKHVGSTLVVVGDVQADQLAGSVYFQTQHVANTDLPHINTDNLRTVLRSVHGAIQAGNIQSAKSIVEGGLAAAVAKMCFGGDCGAVIDLDPLGAARADLAFFNETTGCFVVEVPEGVDPKTIFGGVPHAVIGKTTADKHIVVRDDGAEILNADLYELKTAWQAPMKEMYP